jgi:uncharacterized protein (TIGR02271 family)
MKREDAPTQELRRPSGHVERAEERLVPEVERAEAGRLVVRRRTAREPETVELQLTHDELDIERVKADRRLGDGEPPVREVGDEVVVLVIEERLEVRKVPWVVEELHVRRRLVTEAKTITDEVRKEHLEVDATGDVVLEER